MNLSEMLKITSNKYPSNVAITEEGKSITYEEFYREAKETSGVLRKLGVSKGDRVVVLAENSTQWIIIYFGIVMLGAIAVPLDVKYKQLELESIFSDCRPKYVITKAGNAEFTAKAAKAAGEGTEVLTFTAGTGGSIKFEGGSAVPTEIFAAEESLGDENTAHIGYTSGPILKNPLGVMVSHGKLTEGLAISKENFHQTHQDVSILFALPLHHMAGLIVVVLTAIYSGGSVVILSELSVEGLLRTIKRDGITIFTAVPFVHALILKEVREKNLSFDISGLRVTSSIGAPLPPKLSDDFKKVFGKELIDFYGLTESTVQVTSQELEGANAKGSVGKALPPWEIKIIGEKDRGLAAGKTGRVMVKGPIMQGIYGKPGETAKIVKDGWLDTGDLGYLDGEGNLFITGIDKKMLINKGQNIYFSDIEEILKKHEKIEDAAALGVADPDRMRGEVVAVAVKPKKGFSVRIAEVKKHCISNMAIYKTPKKVAIVEELPRYAEGGIDYEALKKLFT